MRQIRRKKNGFLKPSNMDIIPGDFG